MEGKLRAGGWQRLRLTGPALGGQATGGPPWAWRADNWISSVSCSAPGRRYKQHLGGPGSRKAGDAQRGDTWWLRKKRDYSTPSGSLPQSYSGLRGGLSGVGLRPHAPLQLPSTTLSHPHHHLLQCSKRKILFNPEVSNLTPP